MLCSYCRSPLASRGISSVPDRVRTRPRKSIYPADTVPRRRGARHSLPVFTLTPVGAFKWGCVTGAGAHELAVCCTLSFVLNTVRATITA